MAEKWVSSFGFVSGKLANVRVLNLLGGDGDQLWGKAGLSFARTTTRHLELNELQSAFFRLNSFRADGAATKWLSVQLLQL